MSLVPFDDVRHAYIPLKRPAIVLEEDVYVESLSKVIKHEFFPDLEQEEEDEFFLASHGTRSTGIPSASVRTTPRIRPGAERLPTPSAHIETAHRVPKDVINKSAVDTSLSLSAFQARYTSEDNASFLELLDRQNRQTREKYAWHYNGNKIYTEFAENQQRRLKAKQEESQNEIGWRDDRPPVAGWRTVPKNALMFHPSDSPHAESQQHATSISHAATRLSHRSVLESESHHGAEHGASEEDDNEDDEPKVNGYGFVDEPDTPQREATPRKPMLEHQSQVVVGTNPFKIADTPLRDQLHEALLHKSRQSQTPRATTAMRRTMATPKFKSSPVLSPAAQRLMGARRSALGERLKTPIAKSRLK